MSTPALVLHQIRYEWRAFWRNPAAAFFGAIFPLLVLVIFNLLFGNNEITIPGGTTRASTFYVPAIAALSVVNSCFTGVAMSETIARDGGVLKRVRGTPLPAWIYFAARIIVNTLVALLTVSIVLAVGALLFGVTVHARALPAFAATIVLGAACFASLGLAITAVVPSADAAPAVVNGTALPLLFISDVFVRGDQAPEWVHRIADLFPIRHLSLALQDTLNPFSASVELDLRHLGALVVWLLIGMVLSRRFFSWEPRR